MDEADKGSVITLHFAQWLAVLWAIAFFTAVSSANAADAGRAKRVLMLFSGSQFAPGSALVEQSVQQVLQKRPQPVDFYAEYLDANRLPSESHYQLFRKYLQEKYAHNPPDVIVTFLILNFELAGRLPAELFPGIPMVLGALTEEEVPREGFGNHVTGVVQRIDFAGALELILKLQPETERIIVIGGTAPLDHRYLTRTKEAARLLAGRVQFDYWTTLPVAEMRQAAASLPPRTVIFFTTLFRDATGKSFLPASVASMLAVSSSVPVYVVADSLIGGGTVGGLVAHLEALGRRLGELAQQVLGGAAPTALPIEVRKDGVPLFDWRALKRWGISESRLPPHSIVRFRELTVWQNYRWHIIAVALLCLAQSVLISGLLIQRRRRRLAEREAASLAGRLITAHEDERRRLARDLHDDLTQRLARLAIDAGKIERSAPVSNHDETGRSMRAELVRLSEDVHALSYRLHPSLLDDLGLVEALNAECDGFSRRESIPVEFKPRDVPRDVRPDTALCLFRVAQESLRNVARHAGASVVEVSLRKVDGGLEIAVRDNGTGFDPTQDRAGHSLGLASMKERVHLLGGELDIDSAPGSGTTVIAWVGLNGEEKS
ncbi:MAG TPA: ATP-binding protein [Candidatus Binatia bacterium]|jgi:signal transduction histidine kinase